MKSIAQTHRTELKPTIESTVEKLHIPNMRNKDFSLSNIDQTQTVLHLFPNMVMNTAIHNGSIQLVADDLIKQNVDVIVVCSTSEVLLKKILEQAGLVVTEEYYQLSNSVDLQNSLIETGPGNLNCKAILFVPWVTQTISDSKILSNSIFEFVSKSLHHILYHPKVYRTVAFPAIGCGLIQCPVNIVAHAMIDATITKLKETMLYFTVSFVILPNQFNVYQGFANKLASIKQSSETFGSVPYSFSKLTLTFTAKQERNLKKCLSDIESHINTCTQIKCREKEENLDIWTQQLVLIFYKYCLDHYIWPTINLEQKKVILIGEKTSIDDADKYFLELTTQALKQTQLDNISRNILWEYQIDSSTWESYSYKCNAEIEYALTFRKLPVVNITNEQNETCLIDFNKNKEIFNSRIRSIRRQNLTNYSLPMHWQCQSTNCCRFILSEHSEEYKNIKDKFNQTMLGNYICIKSIERIQNQRWYKQYAAHRDAMNERLKQETQKILFHGCNEDSANSIVEECFNRSYAGTVYGQGVYFATNAKYSHDYTRSNQANERCMFVVLVLVGKYIFGNSLMKVPPKGYDSTTDNNQIFVVYHDAQAYADYLIKYQ
ncbi:unnamed protein product [Rotaria sp. Silwood1]|nr:unnamed protein product [Rotaria sp. Silwood1]CAF1376156.1 unnamed protein product [Rotaria sp. Silwood1]